jgi:acetolactate synthase I/II/III large subunit
LIIQLNGNICVKNFKTLEEEIGEKKRFNTNGKISSYQFLEALDNQIKSNSIIIPDQGGNLVWSMQTLKPKEERRIFSNFGNSSMGYSLPACIGAAIGNPNKDIICIDGDGGFQMNIQELQTIKQYNLPIKIFILNNNSYGIIKQFQDQYFESRYIATEGKDYSSPNFTEITKAYGIKALDLKKEDDIRDTITYALNYDGPILVNVIIDEEQKLIPKLEFGNPLEYMSPQWDEEYIISLMKMDLIPQWKFQKTGWVNK